MSGQTPYTGSGGGGGGASTIANGADVNAGATTDAAVTTDAAGTLSGKLRGLVALLASVISGGKVTVDGSSVTQPVSGPLTDAQLRAAAVPVSGTVTASGPLTDAQLRAAAVPISAGSLPLPTGAATETTLGTRLTESDFDTKTGALTEAAPASDTASSALNGRLQRIAQRITSLIALLPGSLSNGFFQVSLKESIAVILGTGTAEIGNVKNSGTFATQTTLQAGSALVGQVGIDQTTPGTTNAVQANAGTNLNTSALNLETTQTAMSAKLPASLGQKTMAASMGVTIASNQSAVPVSLAPAAVVFRGRACTFRTPGRAGTTGQKILSLHNATGSAVTVTINKVFIDLSQTVIKAVTVIPPVIRLWKVTVLPTNGTALGKNKIGGSGASSGSVTVLGDASADGTGSGTALTATLPAGAILSQEFAPRLITAAGYEMADRLEFFGDSEVVLAALEGLVVFLDYTLATQNPTTDMWIAGVEWTEV